MLTLGLILLVLAVFGIGRAIAIPLAAILIPLGLVFALLHFIGHSVALLF